jgi:hypothetical protein
MTNFERIASEKVVLMYTLCNPGKAKWKSWLRVFWCERARGVGEVSMKIRVPWLLVMALAMGIAQAGTYDPCAAGTVASVMAQGPCTIVDMIFSFDLYLPESVTTPSYDTQNNDNSAAAVGFLPLTDDPWAPGFRLTGPFWSSAVAPPNTQMIAASEDAFLSFLVYTAGGGARITGINATMNDWSLLTSTLGCPSKSCYSEAWSDVYAILYTPPYSDQDSYAWQWETSGSDPTVEIYDVANPGVPPWTSSASGYVYTQTYVYSDHLSSGGSVSAHASFDSADFRITQNAVPEPGSWMLLGAASVPLLLWARRARQR